MHAEETFVARLESLPSILSWVREHVRYFFEEKERYYLEIVLEEAVVNIISYAYPAKRALFK